MRIYPDGGVLWSAVFLPLANLGTNSMRIGDIRTAHVVVTHPVRSLVAAARLMREKHVGALVVVDADDPQRRPGGMLTDRDIVRGQVLKGADLHCLTVGDVMSRRPLCLTSEMSLAEGIDAMNSRAVRRAPVLDRKGALVGIVTLDNLLPALASELRGLAKLMGKQAHRYDAR
jgi:CBS domain-containing protein